MRTEAASVTDVTDVTRFPYPPHTRARTYGASLGIPVTLVTSVTGFNGPQARGAAL